MDLIEYTDFNTPIWACKLYIRKGWVWECFNKSHNWIQCFEKHARVFTFIEFNIKFKVTNILIKFVWNFNIIESFNNVFNFCMYKIIKWFSTWCWINFIPICFRSDPNTGEHDESWCKQKISFEVVLRWSASAASRVTYARACHPATRRLALLAGSCPRPSRRRSLIN